MIKSVIKVENLSKRYRLGLKEKQAETLIGQVGNLIKSPWHNLKRLREMSRFGIEDESVFWALKDINFEVKEGEVLGIIGKNGAGKSTLLKILSQITEPTFGKIEIQGRVASLLEVGTGFHPELSGRENIYMNGTILGMTRGEIDSKLEEIIDFSGVEKFIDTPVKFYSSGMKVRLGFSVAAHLEPEILIIDEVLAVGDYEFQTKCLGKMEDVSKNQGRTVIFVSHNLGAVSLLCDKGILLQNGKLVYSGIVQDCIDFYLKKPSTKTNDISAIPFQGTIIDEIVPNSLKFNGMDALKHELLLDPTIPLKIEISMNTNSSELIKTTIGISRDGVRLLSVFDFVDGLKSSGGFISKFIFPANFFRPGIYNLGFGADIINGPWMWFDQLISFQVLDKISIYIDKGAVGLINVKPVVKTERVEINVQ